ncbi:Nif3-like dinuclear metal center hexameric protein [Archaeoglobus veneficus]|uniref:NGG1p interacting factor 3 protein, NIF3 n=1 Tax=Archaeoglobus veneficus (strain DSM 11195 / SNP6) TaxID=693661 RepID=F2KSB0_ARCVS|nr:Nif3-like dinuclear metal center hexameric protein [Archaeoglobus veneficus]AEA46879.1 NGG1p interacting factor 3 protein, NIF3 [Archaeoglobus veneficus SNP6]
MRLRELTFFLDEFLKTGEWSETSKNGLQVEGKEEVEKVAFAVDACMETFEKARDTNADMLVVHHGLVWGGIEYVTGIVAKRLRFLLENGISLYAAHLPLDAHPEIGNNVKLLEIVGAEVEEPFGFYHGKAIGFAGRLSNGVELEELAAILEEKLQTEVRVLNFGCNRVKRIGAVSGRGGFAVAEAAEKGLDVLITGEAEHSAYHTAKELGVNVIFAGHYATETLGIKALMDVVDGLGLKTEFIDAPTRL